MTSPKSNQNKEESSKLNGSVTTHDLILEKNNIEKKDGISCLNATLCNENARKHSSRMCFYCKLLSVEEHLIKCSWATCDKSYHKDCLAKLPTSKNEGNVCPLHICLTCYNSNPKNVQSSSMLECRHCPTACHDKEECHILGAVFVKAGVFSCSCHFSPECQRGYSSLVHLSFCVECICNENLKFCQTCPAAIHQTCYKGKEKIEGNFSCGWCQLGKGFQTGDIVWAKVYNFQWWPACLVQPADLPDSAQKLTHFDGEFSIKFYGTDDYYWLQKSRMYPFSFRRVEDAQHNFKKIVPNPLFDKAIQLALVAQSSKNVLPAIESANHKKPPPYKHIKCNRPIGDVQIYTSHDISDYTSCDCSAEDACSFDSLCLNRSMCIECHPDVCEAGEHCQNQKFQKRDYAAVKPFWTGNRGWALKCLEDIKKGHFVIEYCGDLIDEEECVRRIKEKQAINDTNFYFCTLDSMRIIDAGPKGNCSRFMNHSCNPNCETQKWMVSGDTRVGIFAKCNISKGSELTFDYHMDFSHYKKLNCNCGTRECSGLIGKKPHNAVLHTSNGDQDVELEHSETDAPVNGFLQNSTTNGLETVKSVAKKHEKDKKLCFKCKTGGKQINCSRKDCDKSFHIRCVRPSFGVKGNAPLKWECPCHFCKKCKKVSAYQCFMCPNSYCRNHSPSVKNAQFACAKHSF